MATKLAVAIVHGVGRPEASFADGMMDGLRKRFARATGQDGLVMQPVFWAPVIQNEENTLWARLKAGGPMDFVKLRRFMVDFAADAIAYQPAPRERDMYDAVHAVVARALRELAAAAGPRAPLCVIAHSLGTVIASNYVYDLQAEPRRRILPKAVRAVLEPTPLEKGETLSGFYTLGSPIALWSLRYKDFGRPIAVPAPKLAGHHPKIKGEWINIYDQDDVIGYPLKSVNDAYKKAVAVDRAVNAGGILSSWNPASHMDYWTDDDVLDPIVDSLAKIYRGAQQ
ncbi:MAG: chemotaxis protein [Elusimicrobia bacterium]|jgi:hypothetical protein|nr:chemotaxis protein [Elusimicrobiota bacterium]MBK7544792.1 chemotaxis protein [Elusimicrobiota bacterium]MBK7574304.1 chemotaxis protein [Elusimicrobiota bacterium]MBK8126451.1 chemotaxis protein [Elusimicrobiota bacterium]MBK9056327.1 chemotaxis protein [Elusimicrobiota bacterium]